MNLSEPSSQTAPKSVTGKTQCSRLTIATKIVAYREITHPTNQISRRQACRIIRVPRSSFQRWEKQEGTLEGFAEAEDAFLATLAGKRFLHRIVLAASKTIQYGSSGVRGVQEFLQLSQLNRSVASSIGALHEWLGRIEAAIVDFGGRQREELAQDMIEKEISTCQDENFHQEKPCLVAIEPVSNFILVEKVCEQRRAEDWSAAMKEGLQGLNVSVVQSTSDEASGILTYVKNELQGHSSDLFHVQQELSRATSGGLKAQEKQFANFVQEAVERLKKKVAKHGEGSSQAREAREELNLRRYGLELRSERRDEVREAKKAIGDCYHPVDLKTGSLQTVEEVQAQLKEKVDLIEQRCREAELSVSCLKRVSKARGMIAVMIAYFTFFIMTMNSRLKALQLSSVVELFFREVLIPLAYLESILRKASSRQKRGVIEVLLDKLHKKAREGPWPEEMKEHWLLQAREITDKFQRSSSCVEGRNGVLALKHHSFHGLKERRLKALTVIHNFDTRRSDGTTPAERFFGKKHDKLFDHLLSNVSMLGRPRRSRRKNALQAAA